MSASAECRHWSGRAVRWSSCAILLSCACAWRRWRSRSARPSSCRTTSTLSGTISASIRRRRPPSESATTGDRSRCRCSHAPRRTLVRHLTMPWACGARCEVGHGLTRVLPFGSPSGRRDQMTFCIGRRELITLLGGAACVAAGGAGAAASAERSTNWLAQNSGAAAYAWSTAGIPRGYACAWPC